MMPSTPGPILSSEASATKVMPWNVKVLGFTSLLNDTAGEMIYPLLPTFLITVLGGNKLTLGLIEGGGGIGGGLAEAVVGGEVGPGWQAEGFCTFWLWHGGSDSASDWPDHSALAVVCT